MSWRDEEKSEAVAMARSAYTVWVQARPLQRCLSASELDSTVLHMVLGYLSRPSLVCVSCTIPVPGS